MTEQPWSEIVGQPAPAKLPPKGKPVARAPQLGGCEHTTDPSGWVMDADGNITGKCPCWQEGITR